MLFLPHLPTSSSPSPSNTTTPTPPVILHNPCISRSIQQDLSPQSQQLLLYHQMNSQQQQLPQLSISQQNQQQSQLLQQQSQQLPPGIQRSRARADTLPSRLPPGLVNPSSASSSSFLNPDSGPSSHLYSGVSPRISPSIGPSTTSAGTSIYSSSSRIPQFAFTSQQNSSTSSLPLNNSAEYFDPYRTEIPFTTPTSASQTAPNSSSSSSASSTNSSSSSAATTLNVPTASRLRSGSLNIIPDSSRSSIYPSLLSSNSIWSQRPSHLSSATDSKRASQSSLFNTLEEGSIPERHPSQPSTQQPTRQPSPTRIMDQSSQNIDPQAIDPLGPFYKELTMRTDPSRMRSYTVNNLPYGINPYDLSSHDNTQQQQPIPQHQYTHNQINQAHSSERIPQQASPQNPVSHVQQQQHQVPQPSLTRHASLLGGNRPRAQTTASAFDPPLSIGNVPLMRVPQNQSHVFYTAQDPVTLNDIIVNSLDDASVGPTRSLWIGNIPASTTSYALQAIFSSYGTVESARVLPHKNCGFVNFVNVESAIQAKDVLNDKEIFSGTGPCRVIFAKVVDLQEASGYVLDSQDVTEFPQMATQQPSPSQATAQKSQPVSPQQQSQQQQPPSPSSQKDESSSGVEYAVTEKDGTAEPTLLEPPKTLEEIANDLVATVTSLGSDSAEQAHIASAVKRALEFTDFRKEIGTVPEPRPDRIYDAPTLREVRKKIDSGSCTPEDIEDIALDILDEIAELSSDYVGNTVVQKLFDSCSEPVKDMMLKKIGPHLAQISIHKNGTWAAQKIIAVAGTDRQISMITEALHPYTVHLFLDQFGNYAIQCVLKFGTPWNDFIFETMLSKFWEIAQGRFGARAMRACLESHYVSKEQQCMIAAAITMHAVQLATNANGALLLTWFLDTYTVPNRHTILAPKLIPHLVQLGTHRLASLTVLKVVNYRSEPGARQAIFETLFNPSEEAPSTVLEQILNHSYGPTFIFKILSTPFLDGQERQNAINKIRTVLISIKALPNQGYKRLMDEVGLSTRTNSNPTSTGSNNPPRNTNNNGGNSNRIYHNNQMNQYGMRGGHQRGRGNGNVQPHPAHGGPSNQFYSQPMMGIPPQMVMQQAQQQLNKQGQYGNRSNNNGNNSGGHGSPTNTHSNINKRNNGEMYSQMNQYGPQMGMPGMGGIPPGGNVYDMNMMSQQFDKMNMGLPNDGSQQQQGQQYQPAYASQMMGGQNVNQQNFYGGAPGQQQHMPLQQGNGYGYDGRQ